MFWSDNYAMGIVTEFEFRLQSCIKVKWGVVMENQRYEKNK